MVFLSLSLSFSFYFFSSFFLFPVCCVWYYVIRQALATTSFSLFLLPNTSASLAAQDTIDRHETTGGVKKKKRVNKLLIKYKKTDTAQSFLSIVNSTSDRARLSPLLKRCRKDFCQLFFCKGFPIFLPSYVIYWDFTTSLGQLFGKNAPYRSTEFGQGMVAKTNQTIQLQIHVA